MQPEFLFNSHFLGNFNAYLMDIDRGRISPKPSSLLWHCPLKHDSTKTWWIPKTWAHRREFWAGGQEGCQSTAVVFYYRINYSTIILGEHTRTGLVGTPQFFKVLSPSPADAMLKPMSLLPNGTSARIKCCLTDGSAVFVKKALHLTILKADFLLRYSFTASQLHFIWTIHLVLKSDL